MGREQLGKPDKSGRHGKSLVIGFDVTAHFLVNDGAFRSRAYKIHVALDDIEQLRQFVKPGIAQNGSKPGHQLVFARKKLGAYRLLRVRNQRAEFVHGEQFFVDAKTQSAIKNFMAVLQFDHYGNEQKNRGGNYKKQQGQSEVERSVGDQMYFGVAALDSRHKSLFDDLFDAKHKNDSGLLGMYECIISEVA